MPEIIVVMGEGGRAFSFLRYRGSWWFFRGV